MLEEDDYQRVLKKAHQRIEAKKIEFLNDLPFLKHLNQGNIKAMQRSFIEQPCILNQTLVAQGKESLNVFVIKDGEFEVSRKIKQKKQKSNDPFDNRI